MNRHILQTHSPFKNSCDERIFTCNLCEKKFFDKKDHQRHMFVHTQVHNVKCTFCEFSHVRKSSHDNHMRLCHPVSVNGLSSQTDEICDYCLCLGKRSIKIHIECHLDVHRNKCDQCGYTCQYLGDFKKH